jgi:hypothetical protein
MNPLDVLEVIALAIGAVLGWFGRGQRDRRKKNNG